MDYDDVVDAVATEARRNVRTWAGSATRRTAIVVTAIASALALLLIVSTGPLLHGGPAWTRPAVVALDVSGLYTLAAVSLSRALADAGTGAAVGTIGLFFAFAGGLTVFNGHHSLLGVQSQQFVAGAVVLIAASVLCYAGVADRTQFFVAGIHAGLFGVIAALIGLTDLRTPDIAGILLTAVVVLTPMLPLLSIRLGKLPVPALPASTEDLLAEQPKVPLPRVYATVRRSDELLTGMLMGNALVAVIAQAVLVLDARRTALILVGLATASMLLQGRLFPTLRHRTPLMVAGVGGAAMLVAHALTGSDDMRLMAVVPALLVVSGLVLAAGRHYRHRQPGPYLGRIADIFDVLLIIAVVPMTCLLVGLFGYMRGLYH
jgi:type VII secretion integral membrane protein EccD